MSIASELKAVKDELATLKASPAPMVDVTDLHSAIDALSAKVNGLTALVGTPDELNPPS